MPNEIHPDPHQPDPRSTLDEIGRLQSDRAHRDARRTFFVEGVRNVVEAIENGFRIETLVYSDQLLTVPIARRLIRDRRRSGTPTLSVSPEAFRQVSTTPRASGVGAIVAQRWSPLHDASPRAGPLLGRARGRPLRRQPRQPDPDLGGRRRGRVHPGRAADRPLRPRRRPRLDGGAVPSVVHPHERPKPQALAPPPPLPGRRRVARGSADLHRFDFPGRRSSSWARSAGDSVHSNVAFARTSSASRWSARPTR